MDKQELFDAVVRHAYKQRVKSVIYEEGSIPRCQYRGPNGLRCFFGGCAEYEPH